ncbi:MAG: hypothetical protein U0167_09530 [bacterium]
MRSSVRVLLAAALLSVVIAAPSLALEKQSRPFTGDNRADHWRAASSCDIVYYNFCTGWVWIWSGWGPGDRLGVSFNSCCGNGNNTTAVGTTFVYFGTGAPAGYGFTGTMDVFDADANQCPTGASIASLPFLPVGGQWNTPDFGFATVPDSTFAVVITMGPSASNPSAIESDHPAAGPTGGIACGTCYSNTRVNHSFYWGTNAAPLCPGSSFNDGVCDAQLIMDAGVRCTLVSIEPTTWGAVKNLYR